MGTLLIKSGKVIDGTGKTGFEGHLLLRDDKIDSVFQAGEALPESDAVIDANGCVIAPGFIDMHSHGDWLLPQENHQAVMNCMLEQGVTTLVTGNCGYSPAPVKQETIGSMEAFASLMMDKPFDYTWTSVGDFFDQMDAAGPALNMAMQIGHASARFFSANTLQGSMPQTELQNCLDTVERAFDEGACGLSFGLGYDPGMYSPLEELEAFCGVAAKKEKPVTVHLKALSKMSPCYPLTYLKPHNIRALKEMIDVAKKTGIRLQLSHFIFVGRNSWSTASECLDIVDNARREGLDVMIDAFPYTCGNTTINAPMPYWFLATLPKGYDSKLARMRLRLELEFGFRLVGFIYKDFQVMDSGVDGWEDLNGLRIPEIAEKWHTSSFDAMLRLSQMSGGGALMLFHAYSGEPGNEKPLESVLSHDLCLFETDVILKSRGHSNPAATGTFPRILGKYVRDKKLLNLEDAVHRMTGASAQRFGIKNRGTLSPGNAADVVLFDPETISDTPPAGREPAGRPKGITHVFLNGRNVVKDGLAVDNTRAGRMIRQ